MDWLGKVSCSPLHLSTVYTFTSAPSIATEAVLNFGKTLLPNRAPRGNKRLTIASSFRIVNNNFYIYKTPFLEGLIELFYHPGPRL